MTDTIDSFRDWDAAYVLGALSADDRRAFERHLVTCPECSTSVAELAGLPGILGKLSREDAVAIRDDQPLPREVAVAAGEHTPGLVQRLAATANRRRRRNRLAGILSAAAVVVVLVAGGTVWAATSASAPSTETVAMAPLGHEREITASLQVTRNGWGTRFDWSCSYADGSWKGAPVQYDLVVTQKSGAQSVVASWSTAGPHASGLSASSSIPTSDIRSVEIRLRGSSASLLRATL